MALAQVALLLLGSELAAAGHPLLPLGDPNWRGQAWLAEHAKSAGAAAKHAAPKGSTRERGVKVRHEKSKTGKQPASHYHVQSDADSEQHLHLMKPPDDKDSAKESTAPSPFVSVWNKVSNSAKGKCRKPPPQAWNRDVLGQMSKIREHMTAKPKSAPAFCCDWMGDTVPPATSQVALEPLDAVNVLAFSAIGREYAQHTRFRTLLLNELGVSSFLAHYDNAAEWYQNQGWYATLVRYSASYPETSKARYLANALQNRFDDVFVFYSHVWLLDEDVIFPPAHHVRGFISIAARLGALLTQPSVDAAQSPWPVLHANSVCAVRSTDMIDTQMPLMRTEAAVEIFTNLFPKLALSDWGLDATWCKYLERKYGTTQPACVVATSGGFHKTAPQRMANYSRLEPELCMRSEHKVTSRPLCSTRPPVDEIPH